MARSKPPNEILALGANIVRDLELEPSVDTLGRWMAHHLAEVMLKAEKASGRERQAAQAKAIELILKLWSRRHDLPGRIHPLKQLEGAISVLRRLQFDASQFFWRNESELTELIANAFYELRMLVVHGVLIASSTTTNLAANDKTLEFLDEDEKQVFDAIRNWIDFINSGRKSDFPIRIAIEEDAKEEARLAELKKLTPAERSRRLLIDRIDTLIATLQSIRTKVSVEIENTETQRSSQS
jgi:hypothetical protein